MRKHIKILVLLSVVFLFAGCGGDNKTQTDENISEAIVSQIDINDSHNSISSSFGVDSKYNQVDVDGSILKNRDIDFSQNDALAHRLRHGGDTGTEYHFIRIEEYGSYVKVVGEEWRSISGASEVVSHYGAWTAIPKYDKPVMYDETKMFVENMWGFDGNGTAVEPVKHEALEGELVSTQALFQGSAEVQERTGKHYEVVRSAERLAALYEKAGIDTQNAYDIDFETYHVLALFMGSVNSSGAKIELTKLIYANYLNGDQTIGKLADVENTIPPVACEAEPLYLPYQFIALPAYGDISFTDIVKIEECD